MKKVYLVLVAFLICVSSSAQVWDNSKPDKRFTFGVRAGINTAFIEDIGCQAGFNADININKSFAVETGLFWYLKGDESDNFFEHYEAESHIQLPILAMGRLFLSENSHLQFKGGFYTYYCPDAYDTYDAYIDVGMIFGTGFKYKNFYLGCQYEGTFLDYYHSLALSIGYDF